MADPAAPGSWVQEAPASAPLLSPDWRGGVDAKRGGKATVSRYTDCDGGLFRSSVEESQAMYTEALQPKMVTSFQHASSGLLLAGVGSALLELQRSDLPPVTRGRRERAQVRAQRGNRGSLGRSSGPTLITRLEKAAPTCWSLVLRHVAWADDDEACNVNHPQVFPRCLSERVSFQAKKRAVIWPLSQNERKPAEKYNREYGNRRQQKQKKTKGVGKSS
ncbi:hypothetical protein CCM_06427 [Cordyceps militaris CM01]|uniref:Uncharacterized protein n=1 Tax=Cordyceps militaris (strain CM01) TaxID=983644 RepID=G3JMB9_CORMM|nr:uncharacterized protein CCM_06427 [Cordyceps militaris CM01]EGX90007.1 hypothetical protein CCM_06427 [Cordyceps militaris CM01]